MEYTSKVVISFYVLKFLTFRRNSHAAQKLPEIYLDKIQEFLLCNIKVRSIKVPWIEINDEHRKDSNIFKYFAPTTV